MPIRCSFSTASPDDPVIDSDVQHAIPGVLLGVARFNRTIDFDR
jgi:hypothetical protein